MPYKISKVRGKDCWRVINKITGKVHMKCGTLVNAKRQIKLMEMMDARKGI